MRIISGKYKGKMLKGFDILGTRPTMDRVKESLFGSIQNYIKYSICLDLFAGSGNLGLESLSNGAKKCYFVDNNIKAIDVIKSNLINVSEEYEIIKDDFKNALKKLEGNKFDIIFLDPPYDDNLIQISLDLIKEYNLLSDNGIIICEYEREVFECDYEIIKEKKYGSKNIRIYKNII